MQQQTTLQKIYLGYEPDLGCEAASKFVNGISKCSQCPWIICLKDIRYQTRQLLTNSQAIEHVFTLDKQCTPFYEICALHPTQSPFTIRKWLNCQDRIQKTIDQYRWAIPFL
jgi:hypothetical protein